MQWPQWLLEEKSLERKLFHVAHWDSQYEAIKRTKLDKLHETARVKESSSLTDLAITKPGNELSMGLQLPECLWHGNSNLNL